MGGQSSGKKGSRARLDTAPTHRNTGHLGQVGFEGQDAFDPDADELALDGRTQSARGPTGHDSEAFDEQAFETEEVLPLKLRTKDSGLRESTQLSKASREVRKRKDSGKHLQPLLAAQADRFALKRQVRKDDDHAPDADAQRLADTPAGGGLTTLPVDESDADQDEWATTGGYHVSRNEALRVEARQSRRNRNEEDLENERLEISETLRLQREARSRLAEDDFGPKAATADIASDVPQAHTVPERGSGVPTERQDAIRILVSREPELLALIDDYDAGMEDLKDLRERAHGYAGSPRSLAFIDLHHELLASYLLTLAYYLHVRSHREYPKIGQALASRALSELVKLRTSLASIRDLGLDGLSSHDSALQEAPSSPSFSDMSAPSGSEDMVDELAALSAEEACASAGTLARQAITDENAHDYAERGIEISRASSQKSGNEPKAHRKRKRSRSSGKGGRAAGAEQPSLLQLEPLIATPSPGSSTTFADLLEPNSLTDSEVSEKARRRKTLRFYTSKIDAKGLARNDAARGRAGGDTDLPYRSKEKARASVLQKQNPAPIPYAALDAGDFTPADLEASASINADLEQDGYYNLVAQKKARVQHAKTASYEAEVLSDRARDFEANTFDPNNPRAVNRQIMSNKGLTPKRPKSVRNPRVKKRMRYDKAQKKVASMKPVYKGGLGNAAYEGEKSGISSRVVKSRFL